MMLTSLSDLQIMALTVWGEARGETDAGKSAVAWVIRNRADHPRWWGRDLRGVCLKSHQFSCWNKEDPNYKHLINPATRSLGSFIHIQEICEEVLSADKSLDMTLNSDHYCTMDIAHRVYWAKGRQSVTAIGHHYFYRLELDAP